jgi:hypothetical protein
MAKPDEQPNLPHIPDGGLSESMPEWLRRPPAWRTLKDSEIVAPAPAATATLPEADTSPIDPRSFLTDDDLPGWLRALGRGWQPVVPPGDEHPADEPAPSTPAPAEPTEEASPSAGRFVPLQPAPSTGPGVAPEGATPASTATRGTEPAPHAWWQRSQVVALLAAALLVAIVAIVILAVA